MKYTVSHKEDPREWHRQASMARRRKDPVGYLLVQAKYRAKKKGIEFTVTREDIEIPTHCPVFGFELEITDGKRAENSYSIDRLDNSKGYVPGNVKVISWKANQYKGNLTVNEVKSLLNYMEGSV